MANDTDGVVSRSSKLVVTRRPESTRLTSDPDSEAMENRPEMSGGFQGTGRWRWSTAGDTRVTRLEGILKLDTRADVTSHAGAIAEIQQL